MDNGIVVDSLEVDMPEPVDGVCEGDRVAICIDESRAVVFEPDVVGDLVEADEVAG